MECCEEIGKASVNDSQMLQDRFVLEIVAEENADKQHHVIDPEMPNHISLEICYIAFQPAWNVHRRWTEWIAPGLWS